jgi:endogenous inhibitor of DNA gyrase (YacG/DUF329 family)
MSAGADTPPPRPCPICGKPSLQRWRPFCSKRCADIDLHRWLGGRYVIPAAETDDESRGPGGDGDAEANHDGHDRKPH